MTPGSGRRRKSEPTTTASDTHTVVGGGDVLCRPDRVQRPERKAEMMNLDNECSRGT